MCLPEPSGLMAAARVEHLCTFVFRAVGYEMSHPQSEPELIGHLIEQVGFLRASADAYDAGEDSEAKRLATVVRTLCHDTPRSTSLLQQLGSLTRLRFVDTIPDRPAPNLEDLDVTPSDPDGELKMVTVFSSPLAPMAGGPRGYVAQLDRASRSLPKTFATWWGAPVVRDAQGNSMSRRDVVLALANQDGGAHVDPSLKQSEYVAISREQSLGTIEYTGSDGRRHVVDANPLLAVMRQIAYEVDETLAPVVGTATGDGPEGLSR